MDLLQNALDSIELGIADSESKDAKRAVSALRNLHAGVLLLIKEVLLRLSPADSNEVLIEQHILPVKKGADVTFVGHGKSTVDMQQMQARCDSLGIKLDWTRIRKIGDLRNNAEHYYVSVSAATVQSAIATSFVVIRDIMVNHLKEDPATSLEPSIWSVLLRDSEVHDAEKKACVEILEKFDWGTAALGEAIFNFQCPKCGSDLIGAKSGSGKAPDIDVSCRSCSSSFGFEEVAEGALRDYFFADSYLAMTDGGEAPLEECPHCSLHTYVMEEQTCGACLEKATHVCKLCENLIPGCELDSSGICGYCRHMMEKSRDE